MLNLATQLRKFLMVAVIVCVFHAGTLMASEAVAQAEQTPSLMKTGGLQMAYIYSFYMDKCGQSELGKTYRKAIFAKLESCPFTQEARQNFYKDAAEYTGRGLSEMFSFAATHSPEDVAQRIRTAFKDAHCDANDEQQSMKIMQDKLSEYKAGKIRLTDIVVHVKAGTDSKLGEPASCKELSNQIYPDSSSSSLGSSMDPPVLDGDESHSPASSNSSH